MAFSFGGLSTSAKVRTISGKELSTCIISNHFNENEDYYLFLLEGKPENKDLQAVESQITKAGYKSYIIASATNAVYKPDEILQKYEWVCTNQSNWRSLIKYNGKRASAIMAFGVALYAINKGTDLLSSDFYESKMMNPYYYMGHGFIGDFDTFIFPVDGMDKLYPKFYKKTKQFSPTESVINWQTRFFYEQLQNMLKPKELPDDMRDYKIIAEQSPEKIKEILNKLKNADVLAWDTETGSKSHENGLRWYREDSFIHCFTFCKDGETGYYVPAKPIFESEELSNLLCEVMYTCNTMVGANIKFDLHFLRKQIKAFDMNKVKHIDDIGQMIHAVNSDVSKGLKPAAFRYTYFGGYDDQLDIWKKQTDIEDYSIIPFDILYKYATIDAIVTYRIFMSLINVINKIDKEFPNEKSQYMPDNNQWTLMRWYNEVMQEAYPCFVNMEHEGMRIDYEYLKEVRERLQERLPIVAKKLASIWDVPEDFQFGSVQQLGRQIEKMGWPKVQESKAGLYATNDDCIKEWQRQNRPGINDLIEWRLLNSILNTFIGYSIGDNQNDAKGWEVFITYHPEDKSYRIHQSYAIMGTTTFRCIGKDPNLQNIPVHADIAQEVKRCITVPTAIKYTIESDDGSVYVGGQLDTVEVEGKGTITLDKITESDNIIPGTFKKYKHEREDMFTSLKDHNFVEELISEYGDISDKWKNKYKENIVRRVVKC